jgi:hypothetical protein
MVGQILFNTLRQLRRRGRGFRGHARVTSPYARAN